MLRLPPFEFHQPKTLKEAAKLLAESPQTTRLVAGGTDLWPNMKRRHQKADRVISLRNVKALRGIKDIKGSGGALRIGPTTTLDELARDPRVRKRYPALVTAVESISSPLLRNTGTIGGNLCLDTRCTYYNQNKEWRKSIAYCMKAEGQTCWVAPSSPRCWAVSSGDSVPMLCAWGAEITLQSHEGERTLKLADLYKDDGIDYLTKRPDEILTEIRMPAPSGERAAFLKLRRRGSIDFGVLSVAAVLWPREGTSENNGAGFPAEHVELWLGSVGSYPVRCTSSIERLAGRGLTADAIQDAAAIARKSDGANPLGNTDFAPQWRGKMIEQFVRSALEATQDHQQASTSA